MWQLLFSPIAFDHHLHFCWARLCCMCFLSIVSIELHKCYGFFVFFFGHKFTGHWFKVFSLLLLFLFVYIHLRDVAWSTVSNEKNTQMKYHVFSCVSKCKWSIIIFCYCSVYLFVAMIKLSREFHYWVISYHSEDYLCRRQLFPKHHRCYAVIYCTLAHLRMFHWASCLILRFEFQDREKKTDDFLFKYEDRFLHPPWLCIVS